MNSLPKLKLGILLIGDILCMYVSLIVMLLVRFRTAFSRELLQYHLLPFSILFVIWLMFFYIAGLYDFKNLKNKLEFKINFSFVMLINFLFAIMFFYIFTIFGVSPKTNLLLFFVLFGIVNYSWRHVYNIVITRLTPLGITILGRNKDEESLINYINNNPQLGYRIKHVVERIGADFEKAISDTDILVIPDYTKKDKSAIKHIYNLVLKGLIIKDVSSFYEEIFGKIPLSELEESWFIENLASQHRFFDSIKRPVEFVLSIVLLMLFLPLIAIIALIIRITSPGNIIYRQKRVGKNERVFTLYKFRTMIQNAEDDGPKWAEEDDNRITPIGGFLRKTHLDELPQLINVIKGNLSFVGPRPERPEFVEYLKNKIPYYEVRHIVKPGITGWAQINYKYASSIDETYEKLQFDLYYIKNRSLILDMLILLKTLKTLFVSPK
ncbi:MAG: exopolysaccharide biosynthesis polyprenyl glycosylphosphotransferase [bacterium]